MDLLLLCGGKGTRLATITNGKQKCSLEINGKPFILHIIDSILEFFAINTICLCVGHSSNDIISIDFSKYIDNGIDVCFSVETESLGTGGAVKQAISQKSFSNELIICNGDSICDLTNLRDGYLKLSKEKKAGIIASASLSNSQRYGTLLVDSNNRIQDFEEKKVDSINGIINAGVYIFDLSILDLMMASKQEKIFSIEKDIFPYLVKSYDLYIADPTDIFIDIGVPNDFNRASYFLKSKS